MGFIYGTEGYDAEKELSVSFTGHRSQKLPWGCDERDERCAAFKSRLRGEIERAYAEGYRYFLSGMAEGVDIYAAEAVLELSKTLEEIKLVAVFPYGLGSSPRAKAIAKRAFRVVSLHECYTPSCYMERNSFLIRHSSRLICGYSGEAASGTGATMRMARSCGIEIVILNT